MSFTDTMWEQCSLMVCAGQGKRVTHCGGQGNSSAESEANAGRIVACVNAFHGSGLQSENIPAGSATQMLEGIRTFVERCERGEIRSRRTYASFKAILAGIDGPKEGGTG